MSTGPKDLWGIFKEYIFRKNEEVDKEDDKEDEQSMCYISLYHITSLDQVDAKILADQYQTLEKLKKIEKKFSSFLSSTGFASLLGSNQIIHASKKIVSSLDIILMEKIKPNKTLVFDDFERCHIPLKELLGKINYYVEHMEFRTIIICDDENIGDDDEEFKRIKEKTIGQQVKINPDVEGFIGEVIKKIPIDKNEHREIFNFLLKDIIYIFDVSEVKSLRVLEHCIRDILRFLKEIEPRYFEQKDEMHILIMWFFIKALEVRGHNLSESDLDWHELDRERKFFRQDKDANEKNAFDVIAKKYKFFSINLSKNLISHDCIKSMLLNGIYDKEIINNDLENEILFKSTVEPSDLKVLSNFHAYSNENVENSLNKVWSELRNNKINDIFILMKSLKEMILFCQNGVCKHDFEEFKKISQDNISRVIENIDVISDNKCQEIRRLFNLNFPKENSNEIYKDALGIILNIFEEQIKVKKKIEIINETDDLIDLLINRSSELNKTLSD